MNRFTRWLLVGIGVVAIAAASVWLLTLDRGVEVETGSVTREALNVAIVEEGRTRVRSRYVVAAPVTGRLARIALTEGDAVIDGAHDRYEPVDVLFG